jgi:cytoskeleton protein RodZ
VAELGQRLRQTRENLGLSLEDVEQATHIRRAFIQALEEDRYDDLPGTVYARGFIRNYARLLQLDAEELLRDFEKATGTSAPIVPQILDEPLIRPSRTGQIIVTLGIILLIAVIAFGAWYGYNRIYLGADPLSLGRIFAPPEPTATPTTTPTLGALPVAPELDERRTPTTEAEVEPTPQPTPTATVTPTPSPTPITGVVVEAQLVVPTYVEVTVDGESIYVGTLDEGEDRVWTGDESVQIRVGNAGGIELTVNGVEVGAPGAPGQVMTLEYTLDNLPQE